MGSQPPSGWRELLLKEGPDKWAQAIRHHQGTLITDTTMQAFITHPLKYRMQTGLCISSTAKLAALFKVMSGAVLHGG